MHSDCLEGRRWNAFIGREVHYAGESETHGVLRYVGYLRQSDRPRSMVAGVEWSVLPRHRRTAAPGSPEAPHNGVVHGERLFHPQEESTRCSCEPVARILLLAKRGQVPPPPRR
ncbi:hypothetical protein STCU_10087 [Strigomonas culicis]|uniref:Uncharacterized protein n=1 Tax=Strigomonas culicis TaxID=28005 RepID=S9V5T9_9TRYP|nr:hypothetical protein STCU_10087 [Strigomonas culicis]|eukprot:EPY18265.1 hypothetical protein STCU_10087 [Strigomonas culicis]